MPAPRQPDRSEATPLWAQVLEDLRGRLGRGEFAAGFPTDQELVQQYGVSRHTVRDAVRRLQDEGVLTRQRGRGSEVRELEQPVGPLYSLFRTIEDQGFEQRSEVLAAEERADPVAARHMGIHPRTRLVHLRRLRLADHLPVAVDDLWLTAAAGRPLLDVDLAHTSVYTELERLSGLRPTSGWERIHPGLPSAEEAFLLGVGRDQPVFVIERRTDADGEALEYRRTVVPGDRYTFVTMWRGAETAAQFAPRPP